MDLPDSINSYVRNLVSFKAGQVIFEEGSPARYVFLVVRGKVRVKKTTPKGMVTLAVLERGNVLGETSFFDKTAKLRAVGAFAETDVELGVLDPVKMVQELESISPIQHDILTGLARRIRLTTTTAALLAGQ